MTDRITIAEALWGDVLGDEARSDGSPYRPSVPLPLPEVDWGLTVEPGELADTTWPPPRHHVVRERLQLYHDLNRGDLARLIDVRQLADAHVGPLNAFRRIAKFVADLLVREAPTAGMDGALADIELLRVAHSVISHAVRHGTGYLLSATTPQGPMLRSVDPRFVYAVRGGAWAIVEPRVTDQANTATPDMLLFTLIAPDGTTMVVARTGRYSTFAGEHQVGPVTAGVELGTSLVVPVLSLPEQGEGVWGTSWFDDLISTVIQKARRFAANTRILDEHSDPLLIMRGNLDRLTQPPGVPLSGALATSTQAVANEQAVAKRLRRSGPLVASTEAEGAEYLTWDGNLEGSMAQLRMIDSDFGFLSGLPAALKAETQVPSGVSLRRLFWQFDAALAPLFSAANAALSLCVEMHGGTLDWRNAFDVVVDTPTADAIEDVDDESAARRDTQPAPESE